MNGLADAPEPAEGLLTTAELAARPDFALGALLVSPSTRKVRGPGGTADVEPRVMQVLVVLADAANQVVTRDTLFTRCWGGVFVGDDSLNRAVAAVRRIAQDVAAGSFQIATIPRTGYRLTIDGSAEIPAASGEGDRPAGQPILSRRAAVGAGIAAVAVAVGGSGLWWSRSEESRLFEQLLDRGERALDLADPAASPYRYFERAAAMRPDDARAQGFLGYSLALIANDRLPDQPNALEGAERAVQATLSADPVNPYARLANVLLQRANLDLADTEMQLRAILRDAPANIHAMRHLWSMLQSAGRSREALAVVQRAAAIKPLAAAHHYPRAQLLWITGRNAEADRVIDLSMQYWPSHRFVRFARFTILAFTGRARAALAMLEKPATTPQNYSPAALALWRLSLPALEERSPATIAAALNANVAAAKKDLSLASQSLLTLSALGEIDAAFEVANELLQFRGPAEQRPRMKGKPDRVSGGWRFSPWLFTPPSAPMRADARFKTLCDGIGLTEYWAKVGVQPDYLRELS